MRSLSGISILPLLLLFLLLAACRQKEAATGSDVAAHDEENRESKALLQGIWVDDESGETLLQAQGDTIYYADPTSQPAYFRVVGDSIQLGPNTYRVTQLTAHNFCFENHAGDEVRLVKPDEIADEEEVEPAAQQPKIITTTQVVKLDSVVMYGGKRYHWYIAVNPTRNRVNRTTYTPDGVAVEKVYYDNIIHISLFQGAQRLFSRNFSKQAFAADVPEDFLQQSILGNIRYDSVDARGFHFQATVCIPDGESCYIIETIVAFNGQVSMSLQEF